MKNTKIMFIISIIVTFLILTTIFVLQEANNNKQNNNKNNNSINNIININTGTNVLNNNTNLNTNLLTVETVATHNSLSDCWIIINGRVYDVTSYVNLHPGGSAGLAKACGKDGTQLYISKNKNPPKDHSANAYSLLETYYVGDLNQ
ncbi:MAG: cytochrome b5-like heme/steroid binding domain-containing protein [Candidatus Woesearchaeota archaeon]